MDWRGDFSLLDGVNDLDYAGAFWFYLDGDELTAGIPSFDFFPAMAARPSAVGGRRSAWFAPMIE